MSGIIPSRKKGSFKKKTAVDLTRKLNVAMERKEAYDRAKKAGGGKEPIHHNDGKKPHYHPNVKEEYSKTPKGVCKHDHYYYSITSVSIHGLSEEEFYRRLQEMVAER